MKMFIWLDPGKISYGSDFVVVVAKNLEEARKVACKDYSFGRSHPTAAPVNLETEPDEILDLPVGVYHMHSE